MGQKDLRILDGDDNLPTPPTPPPPPHTIPFHPSTTATTLILVPVALKSRTLICATRWTGKGSTRLDLAEQHDRHIERMAVCGCLRDVMAFADVAPGLKEDRTSGRDGAARV